MYDHPRYSIRNILIDNRNWEIYKFNHLDIIENSDNWTTSNPEFSNG